MASGYIYILTNEAMPNTIKIGKTENDPAVRVNQLSSATGVPSKFSLRKQYEVADCDAAEAFAHRVIDRIFGRPNPNREFFSCSAEEAIAVLNEALQPYLSRSDAFSTLDFSIPIAHLLRKEFTPARLQFEEIFGRLRISSEMLARSDSLATAAGGYLACCYATNQPVRHSAIINVVARDLVMKKALKFAEDFESDPAIGLINFVRRF
jgi:hypothetical protein